MSLNDLSATSKTELAEFITRIESLLDEKAEISERIKAEYAEAAGTGFDKKAIQQIIKERAADAQKSVEHREIVEAYRRSLAGLSGTPLGDWARQWVAEDARLKQRTKEVAQPMSDFMSKRRKPVEDGQSNDTPPAA